MHKFLSWGAAALGLVCIVLAGMYFITPAGSLPVYMPGYEAASAHIHLKHGVGSLVLGLGLFAYAWFQGGTTTSLHQ